MLGTLSIMTAPILPGISKTLQKAIKNKWTGPPLIQLMSHIWRCQNATTKIRKLISTSFPTMQTRAGKTVRESHSK
jgi:hypothetical protein